MNPATSTNCIFPVANFTHVKDKVLSWASRFNTFCFLDDHQYHLHPHSVECLVAVGSIDFIKGASSTSLDRLQKFISSQKRWVFGHISYDLKNEIENVHSLNPDFVQFPDLFFFQPEVLIRFDDKEMLIEASGEDEEKIFQQILSTESSYNPLSSVTIQNRIGKEKYLSTIQKLKDHILRGDCYEINFCQEFFAENVTIDPVAVYQKLSAVSPNPFSAIYKVDDKYAVCASPERFLKRSGNRILSQPIKGTAKRSNDIDNDQEIRSNLLASPKERSENVMIVDLVRNDLSKICKEGTVQVDELFGIYSFPQVHQMISTISGELKTDIAFTEIIKATFPMGSMTGAPKKRALELIDKYEHTKRGIFSGAIGYINPDQDFDFNVVIRSIMYNHSGKYLSFQTGSAITFYSDAEQEWEECMLKAEAMKQALR